MKTGINVLLLFAVAFLTKASNGPPDGTMKEFSWLVGKWERTDVKKGETAYEEWWIEEGDLVGKGVTIQDGKTTFVEHLRIEKADNEWYYVAEVSHNDAPTRFRITELGERSFVCVNPNHDFPKKIAYILSGDQLTVTISDEAKGFDFLFKRS